MLALDFAFGLRRWGIKETDVVELEGPAQLGQRVGIVGEKDGVIIDVDLQGAAVGQESGGEEIEVGEQEFALIEFGADEQAAAIVEHIEHGKVQSRSGNQRWGEASSCQSSPIGERCQRRTGARAFGRDGMRQTVFDGPAADLGAVELEGVQAEGFGGGEAVRARRGAVQAFFEEVDDRLGPSGGVVATGGAGGPEPILFLAARARR